MGILEALLVLGCLAFVVVLIIVGASIYFYTKSREPRTLDTQPVAKPAPERLTEVYDEPTPLVETDLNPNIPDPTIPRTCPNCGSALQPEWVHCPQCGAPIQ